METTFTFDSKKAVAAGGVTDQNFTVDVVPLIELDSNKQCELAMVKTSLWYSWRNVTSTNNKLDFEISATTLNGVTGAPSQPAIAPTTITLAEGAYNITDLNRAIQTAL